MLDGWSALIGGAIAFAATFFSDRWKAETADHRDKLKREFGNQRERLEELHSLITETSSAYSSNALEWFGYHQAVVNAKFNIDTAPPKQLPKLSATQNSRVDLIVAFYVPELKSSKFDLRRVQAEYLRLVQDMLNSQSKSADVLITKSLEIHKSCLEVQSVITELHSQKTANYLVEPPHGAILKTRLQKFLSHFQAAQRSP